jgi:hypothetical protein
MKRHELGEPAACLVHRAVLDQPANLDSDL